MAEVTSTTGHESEAIDVQGLKSALQKFKTDHVDTKGTYSKPSGGIPSSDLAQAVQDLLTAAGTALQSSDLTTLNNKVTALEAYFSSEADADTIINKWNEIVAFLAGIAESQTLDGIINGINTQISGKAAATDLTNHTSNTNNPHSVTKSQVGLGNVDNKSAATLKSEIMTEANVKEALGTGSGTAKFLREDGTWQKPDGGNADTVDGYHIAVVASMPASPDANTIYIVK